MRTTALLTAVLVVGVAGCDSAPARLPVFPVSGELRVNGKPAANATLVFHPNTPPPEGVDAPKPRATTDAQGRYELTTYDGRDGAPAGDYRVTVEQYLSNPKQPDLPPANYLPAKFGNPESSGLTATVKAEPNEILVFQVRR